MKKIKTVFVVGPTAAGKTALGVELAKRLDGEVVSADSMQLYRGLHIASAAPDEDEKQGIPHHLIEFLSIEDSFTVVDYVDAAREVIFDIDRRGKLPVIVGGTGLYISSLINNTKFPDGGCDPELRLRLEKDMEKYGAEEMLRRLGEFDPAAAARLHPNNRRRIIRAFEVYLSTGRTLTEQLELSHTEESPYDAVIIGITCRDRRMLYERIEKRVDLMLEKGLIEEARRTLELNLDSGAVQAIGHKELYPYLRGECSLETAAEELKKRTRNYAKRQLTWFARIPSIHWIYTDETQDPVNDALAVINLQRRTVNEWE